MVSGLFVNTRRYTIAYIYETSISSKIACVVLSLFFLLSYLFDTIKTLGITPGHIIPPNFWIWTILTHQFVQVSLPFLLVDIGVLLVSSNLFEATWGIPGFILFFAVSTVIPGLCTAIVYLISYVCTFNLSYLFDVHIHGLWGFISGILVAVKQSKGDQMLIGSIGLYMKSLPMVNLSVFLLLYICGLIAGSYVWMVLFGTYVSWVYLRFFQSHSRGKGDYADSFALHSFFPSPLNVPVGIISNITFSLMIKCGLCKKTAYRYDVGAPSKITISLSGVDAIDAERRRNKALKALNKRLQTNDTASNDDSSEWPDIDDEDDNDSMLDKTVATMSDVSNSTSSTGKSSQSDIVKIDMEEPAGGVQTV